MTTPVLRFLAICVLLLVPGIVICSAAEERIAGYAPAEALRLGEQLYQKGILPSGQPVRAVVQGDIELTGTMTTCANCHLRSGLGSIEGGVLTPPTNGAKLYAPLTSAQDLPGGQMKRSGFKSVRPAYTDESLAEALVNGIGANGKPLLDTMPRYHLDKDSAALLIHYLKNLTSTLSPGVTSDEIVFATIVGKDVSPADRDSLLLPLRSYFRDEWNLRLRDLQRPAGSVNQAPRVQHRVTLEVWELEGPRETWVRQLEEQYARKPVFAILGGVVNGSWEPIHRFCETNRIPCIFPSTTLPVVSENDWYTIYFSKGFQQEGETAAKYLTRVLELPPGKKVVQLYRSTPEGMALARGFDRVWKELGSAPVIQRKIGDKEKTGAGFWKGLAKKYPGAVFVVWLGPADLDGIGALSAAKGKQPLLFTSSTLLAGSYAAVPDALRPFTFVTYPNRLPGDDAYARSLVTNWSRYRNVSVANQRIAASVFSITNLLSRVLIEMGPDAYRDFFLDIWDGGKDETTVSVEYPVLSFGPGQRYAAKGCYVVTLTPGPTPEIVRQSDWVLF